MTGRPSGARPMICRNRRNSSAHTRTPYTGGTGCSAYTLTGPTPGTVAVADNWFNTNPSYSTVSDNGNRLQMPVPAAVRPGETYRCGNSSSSPDAPSAASAPGVSSSTVNTATSRSRTSSTSAPGSAPSNSRLACITVTTGPSPSSARATYSGACVHTAPARTTAAADTPTQCRIPANTAAPSSAHPIRYGAPEAASTTGPNDSRAKCSTTPVAPAHVASPASTPAPARTSFVSMPDRQAHAQGPDRGRPPGRKIAFPCPDPVLGMELVVSARCAAGCRATDTRDEHRRDAHR